MFSKTFFTVAMFLFLALPLSLSGVTSEFCNVSIEKAFYPYLTANKLYMSTTCVREFPLPGNKGKVVTCVVSVANSGESAHARSDMIKVCRARAQVELIKIDEVIISSYSKSSEKLEQVRDGEKVKIKSLTTYLNVIEENVYGVIKSLPVVGTWYSKDKSEFYLAVGIILKNPPKSADAK